MNQTSQYIFNLYHYLLNLRDTLEFTINRDHGLNLYNQRKTVLVEGMKPGSAFGNFLENNKEQAEKLVEKLKEVEVTETLKVGKEGKTFGSISLKQVCDDLLAKYGYDIDKRKFLDKGPLDSLGYYNLKVELHKGVIGIVKVHIVGEEG